MTVRINRPFIPLSKWANQALDAIENSHCSYAVTTEPPGFVIDRPWESGGPIVYRPSFMVVDEHGTRLFVSATTGAGLSMFEITEWTYIWRHLSEQGEKLLVIAFDDDAPASRSVIPDLGLLPIRRVVKHAEVVDVIEDEFERAGPSPCIDRG